MGSSNVLANMEVSERKLYMIIRLPEGSLDVRVCFILGKSTVPVQISKLTPSNAGVHLGYEGSTGGKDTVSQIGPPSHHGEVRDPVPVRLHNAHEAQESTIRYLPYRSTDIICPESP